MARIRVHQHVNPLARYFRELEIEPLNPSLVYENPEAKLHIDLGCGRGRFLLEMARERVDWNFLGLEIREPLVFEANRIRDEESLTNLHFVFCSVSLHLDRVLEGLSRATVELFTIQFPDPWFKKRHQKRRMVDSGLVRIMHDYLARDGKILVQTDVREVDEEIGSHFLEGGFKRESVNTSWLPLKTEREMSVEKRQLPVYRAIYKKEY